MRMCASLFRISEAAGRIKLIFGMRLEVHYISVLRKVPVAKHFTEVNGGVYVQVARAHPSFPYLGNGWKDCAENWCVIRGALDIHFTKDGGYLLERTCKCTHI